MRNERWQNMVLLLLFLACMACERDEIPLVLEPINMNSSLQTTQVEMGDDYRNRLYYNIALDSVVARHRKRDWDIAFESSADGNRIKLNSSKYMHLYRSGQTELSAVDEAGSDGPHYDTMGEFLEFTALSDWTSGEVYVIDRGIDADGLAYGLVKFKVLSMTQTTWSVEYELMDGSGYTSIEILKAAGTNLTHFSFDTGVESLEPFNGDWDFLITHYTRYFDYFLGQDSVQYLVSGFLSNPNGVEVANALSQGVSTVESLSEASLLDYSINEEAIGWDWKEFDLNTGLYTINPNLFVVKSVNGLYFRVKFTGFYAQNGDKGAPIFEHQLLQ